MVNTVDASTTTWQTSDLAPGPHRWRVIATGTDGKLQPSNFFSFVVGPPPPYPCREFSDDFSSPHPDDWALQSMKFSQDRGNHTLEATAPGSAVQKTVRLDKTEGELSVKITPGGTDSVAGVGFQADDGTQLYAAVDLIRNQLRLERKLQGLNATRSSMSRRRIIRSTAGTNARRARPSSGKLPPSRSPSKRELRANLNFLIRAAPGVSWRHGFHPTARRP